jgi:(p)ppGpp synthase/HD superfamily hydrolase
LDKVEFQDANEAQAENFRKMLLAWKTGRFSGG